MFPPAVVEAHPFLVLVRRALTHNAGFQLGTLPSQRAYARAKRRAALELRPVQPEVKGKCRRERGKSSRHCSRFVPMQPLRDAVRSGIELKQCRASAGWILTTWPRFNGYRDIWLTERSR